MTTTITDARPTIRHNVQIKVGVGFKPGDLRLFLDSVPQDAAIGVTTHMGGSQRDPEPVAYTFYAQWGN